MRDEKGRQVDVFVVSGRRTPPESSAPWFVHTMIVLLLRTGEEYRKVEIAVSVNAQTQDVTENDRIKEQFAEKWDLICKVAKSMAALDGEAGKLFVREALEAYRAKDKLRHDQILEAFAGAFLVDPVAQL